MGSGSVHARSQNERRRRVMTHWLDIGWLLMDGRIWTVPVEKNETRTASLPRSSVGCEIAAAMLVVDEMLHGKTGEFRQGG